MKRGATTHPKVYTLAAVLSVPRFAAVGILESLWHFAQGYAQAGDVGRHTDEAIARAIGWEENAATLVSALVQSGWLDRCVCHRVRVHDWPNHADQTVERALASKKLSFITCYDDPSSKLASELVSSKQKLAAVAVPCRAVPTPEPTPSAPAAPGGKPEASLVQVMSWSRDASAAWIEVHGGKPQGAMMAALKRIVKRYPWNRISPTLRYYLATKSLDYLNWDKFESGFETIEAEASGAPARASPKTAQTIRALRDFVEDGDG